jgi:hypothetical protein
MSYIDPDYREAADKRTAERRLQKRAVLALCHDATESIDRRI